MDWLKKLLSGEGIDSQSSDSTKNSSRICYPSLCVFQTTKSKSFFEKSPPTASGSIRKPSEAFSPIQLADMTTLFGKAEEMLGPLDSDKWLDEAIERLIRENNENARNRPIARLSELRARGMDLIVVSEVSQDELVSLQWRSDDKRRVEKIVEKCGKNLSQCSIVRPSSFAIPFYQDIIDGYFVSTL